MPCEKLGGVIWWLLGDRKENSNGWRILTVTFRARSWSVRQRQRQRQRSLHGNTRSRWASLCASTANSESDRWNVGSPGLTKWQRGRWSAGVGEDESDRSPLTLHGFRIYFPFKNCVDREPPRTRHRRIWSGEQCRRRAARPVCASCLQRKVWGKLREDLMGEFLTAGWTFFRRGRGGGASRRRRGPPSCPCLLADRR
jgi:hypothetical protein